MIEHGPLPSIIGKMPAERNSVSSQERKTRNIILGSRIALLCCLVVAICFPKYKFPLCIPCNRSKEVGEMRFLKDVLIPDSSKYVEAPSPIGDNLSNVFIGEHVDMLDSYERLLIRGYVPQTVFWELSERERRIKVGGENVTHDFVRYSILYIHSRCMTYISYEHLKSIFQIGNSVLREACTGGDGNICPQIHLAELFLSGKYLLPSFDILACQLSDTFHCIGRSNSLVNRRFHISGLILSNLPQLFCRLPQLIGRSPQFIRKYSEQPIEEKLQNNVNDIPFIARRVLVLVLGVIGFFPVTRYGSVVWDRGGRGIGMVLFIMGQILLWVV